MRPCRHAAAENSVAEQPEQRPRRGVADHWRAQRGRLLQSLRVPAMAGGAVTLEQFCAGARGIRITRERMVHGAKRWRYLRLPCAAPFPGETGGRQEQDKARWFHRSHCRTVRPNAGASQETENRNRKAWLASVTPNPGETRKVVPLGRSSARVGAT